MPLPLFETLCVAVVLLTLALMARRRSRGALLADYLALAGAGLLGEESCVRLYHHYGYAPGWHARLDEVPLLVPLIWPLVVLSAREVAGALFAGRPLARALVVGAVVAFDASLVEVVAVRAGLWRWAEPGHLGVPVVGILGWGYFAFAADAILGARLPARRLVLLAGAPLVTHAVLVGSWWGLFRWVGRSDLGVTGLAGVGLVGLGATAFALRARRAGRALDLEIALPRMVAASLFVALLVTTAPAAGALWLHAACVAVPYLVATRFTSPARVPISPS